MSLTPTLLLILDGYGLAPAGPGNAASLARTPNIDRLISLPGATRIDASGRAVGLPAGYMGNSEVGHLNIGAGRIVYQDMTRIDVAMETGELASNAALLELLANVKRTGGRLHFAGLLSDGGVHSHINHLGALMDPRAAWGHDGADTGGAFRRVGGTGCSRGAFLRYGPRQALGAGKGGVGHDGPRRRPARFRSCGGR